MGYEVAFLCENKDMAQRVELFIPNFGISYYIEHILRIKAILSNKQDVQLFIKGEIGRIVKAKQHASYYANVLTNDFILPDEDDYTNSLAKSILIEMDMKDIRQKMKEFYLFHTGTKYRFQKLA